MWCVIHVYSWVTHKLCVGKTQMWFFWCKEKLGCFDVMCCTWSDQSSSFTTFVVNYKALKPILGRHLFSGTGHFFIKNCEAWRASLLIFLANLSSLGHRHRMFYSCTMACITGMQMCEPTGHKPEHLHWHIFIIDILFLQTKQSTWMRLCANMGVKLSHTTYKNCSKHLSYATSKTNNQNCSLDDERWWQVGADAALTQPINFQTLNPSALHRLTMWDACWSASWVGLFLGVCLFFQCTSFLTERFHSLFAVGWNARNGVPVCTREEWSVIVNRVRCWDEFTFFQSSRDQLFFPLAHCREDFFVSTLFLSQTKI
jgi:hypothetical protein